MKKQNGVTIVELLVVIFVIGIFIAFFAPSMFSRAANNARTNATRQEMIQIRLAVTGNPDLISGGQLVAGGFKNDVGRLPIHLIELVRRVPDTLGLDSMPFWNPFIKIGWNGPYMRDDGQRSFMYDAWGEMYHFIVIDGDTVGIKSRGVDGEWYVPGLLINDDIQVLF